MKFQKFILTTALLALVLACIVLPANAQSYRGTFTLPFEAHWGLAVLPAGTYTLTTDAPVNASVINVRGNGMDVMVLAGASNPCAGSMKGALELRNVNGTYVITKLTSGILAKEIYFGVPKAIRTERFNAAALPKIAIPVSNQHE